jgi:hypothetical protein
MATTDKATQEVWKEIRADAASVPWLPLTHSSFFCPFFL